MPDKPKDKPKKKPSKAPDKPPSKPKDKPSAESSTEHVGGVVTVPPIIISRPPPISFGVIISALSPSGAIVGGSGFVLTVNGAGFAGNSLVMWGPNALATTFISSTQLTAVVAPANIGVIGGVSVTVTRDTLTSNPVTFSVIPNISQIVSTLNQVTQNFATLQQFQALQPGLIQSLANLQTFLNIESSTINDQQSQLSDAQNQIASLNTQNAGLNAGHATERDHRAVTGAAWGDKDSDRAARRRCPILQRRRGSDSAECSRFGRCSDDADEHEYSVEDSCECSDVIRSP